MLGAFELGPIGTVVPFCAYASESGPKACANSICLIDCVVQHGFVRRQFLQLAGSFRHELEASVGEPVVFQTVYVIIGCQIQRAKSVFRSIVGPVVHVVGVPVYPIGDGSKAREVGNDVWSKFGLVVERPMHLVVPRGIVANHGDQRVRSVHF